MKRLRARDFGVLAGLLLIMACQTPPRPGQVLEQGAVASPEPLASEVGAAILRKGGNAVDAAIAVQFALAVTFPNAGNLGGGGFMVLHVPGQGAFALDYRETAPAAAHPDLFLDENKNVIPYLSLYSHLAAGVPGSVRGMWEAHRKFGSLPWRDLLAPSVGLAEKGFRLDKSTARHFTLYATYYQTLPEQLRNANNFARYFQGSADTLFRQPELAAALRRIGEQGVNGFYKGETARLIVEDMKRGNGIMTLQDLENYRAIWRKPIVGSYRGHKVVSMPPPSSGGIALLQLLNMLENFSVPPHHSAEHIHLVAEIEKRVFTDRSVYLGDSDFYKVPIEGLIDKAYCRKRAADISLTKKTDPGKIAEGKPESDSTLHFSVIDRNGLAVSNTTTINSSYGTGIAVEGAGFILNNEMDDFSSKAGVPNLYGVVGAEANKVEGQKRMLSSMSPTLVYDKGDNVWLVLGTPGGSTIFTTVFQNIVNKVDYHMPLDQAIGSDRFHHQWPPRKKGEDPISIEGRKAPGIPEQVLESLRMMGYTPRTGISPITRTRGNIGNAQGIEVVGTRAVAVSDPRGRGKPAYE